MLHQSLRDVFVFNNPAFLKTGFSSDLAVGQGGFFLHDPKKDRIALAAPRYPQHKEILLIQGTPEVPTNLLGAVGNESKSSKPIKGKAIVSFEGFGAKRGQNQIIALGYDGVDNTKTLSARCEESKTVFLKLSGGPIDQMFHAEGKGFGQMFSLFSGCCDDCGDNCDQIGAEAMADDLVNQVNGEAIMSLGTRTGNKFIRARKVVDAAAPTAAANCQQYLLSVCDEGNGIALGRVQTAAGTNGVRLLSRSESTSIYEVILDSTAPAPTAFSNAGIQVIVDCPTCPSGYTLVQNKYVYRVVRTDAGDETARQAVITQYGITGNESVSRINNQFGQSTYIVASNVALTGAAGVNEIQSLVATGASAGTFTLTFQGQTTAAIAYNANAAAVQAALVALSNVEPGDIVAAGGALPTTPVTLTFAGQYAGVNVAPITANSSGLTGGTAVITTPTGGTAASSELVTVSTSGRNVCVITTPSTIAWTNGVVLNKYSRAYRLTLRDNICGTSRLTELQAYYPNLTIAEVDTSDCVRIFETTVLSACVAPGCPADAPIWTAPQAFKGGLEWTAQPVAGSGNVAVGVIFESIYQDYIANDRAFKYWNYDREPITIEISQHSQDYNDKPSICSAEWPVTEIQEAQLPQGHGAAVREQEVEFKNYERKHRDDNPIVMGYQDAFTQSDSSKYYDMYSLKFAFDYHQSWFSEKNTDTYRLEIYFPEGQGKQFEAAVNGYITSVGIDIEPVVL